VLRVKLKRVDEYNAQRRRVAATYREKLAAANVVTPVEDGRGVHVYHQYTLLSGRRDAIMSALADAEIASAVYYPVPLHRQRAFADLAVEKSSFVHTERTADSDLQIDRISAVIIAACD